MTTFITKARKSEILSPTQRGFNLTDWENAFRTASNVSDNDAKLYRSGIWFHHKFVNARNFLEELHLNKLNRNALLKAYSANANREYKIILEQALAPLTKKTVLSLDIARPVIVNTQTGLEEDANDHIESMIDGVRFPLSEIWKNATTRQESSFQELLNACLMSQNLGSYYSALVSLWNDCLWNNWHYEEIGDFDAIIQPTNNVAINGIISLIRRQELIVEQIGHSQSIWQTLPEKLKRRICSDTKYVRLAYNEKFVIDSWPYSSEDPPSIWMQRLIAEEEYFDDLLNVILPNLGGVTIQALLNVWEMLYSLAQKLTDTFPEDSGVQTIDELYRFSAVVQTKTLEDLVASILNVENNKVKEILSLFTFDGNQKKELWSRPLVRLTKREYIVFVAPLLIPNLLRVIESWMKGGGLALDVRGHLFEKSARKRIKSAIQNSTLLKNAGIYPTAIEMPSGKQKEEIDIVIWIGNTILLGEAKCSVFPSNAIDDHNYHKVLYEAAHQITRKTKLAKQNIEDFVTRIGIRNKVDINVVTLLPFILTNLTFGVGDTTESIPVVDLLVLNRYLRDGNLPMFVEEKDLESGHFNQGITFYSNAREAEQNIKEYLSNPPQIRNFSALINLVTTPLPPLHDGERPTVLLHLGMKTTSDNDQGSIR